MNGMRKSVNSIDLVIEWRRAVQNHVGLNRQHAIEFIQLNLIEFNIKYILKYVHFDAMLGFNCLIFKFYILQYFKFTFMPMSLHLTLSRFVSFLVMRLIDTFIS